MALKKFWHKYFKMIKINTIKPWDKLSCGRDDILSSVWSLGEYFMSGGKGSNHSNSNPGGQTVKLIAWDIFQFIKEIQKLKIYGSRHDIACYFLLVRHQSSFRSSAFYLEDIKHMFSMSAGLIHRIPLYKWKIKPVSGWGISITFAIVRYFPQSIVLSSC